MNFKKVISENLSKFISIIGDARIEGLEWKINNNDEYTIELKSNKQDIIKFELDKYNDLFARIYMNVYFSKDKCTMLGPDEDPFFNPDNISYSDDMEFKTVILDRKTNTPNMYIERVVEDTVEKSKAYEKMRNLKCNYRNLSEVENSNKSIEEVDTFIKDDIKRSIEFISSKFNIDDLEDFVKLMCMTINSRDINEFIHILGDNYEDLSPNCIYEELLNLSWSGGYSIKDDIVDSCIKSTCNVTLLKHEELSSI